MSKLLATLAILGTIATAATATTWLVPSPECPTIQAGIDAASNGDTVLVAADTYYEHISLLGKQILLTSEGGADVTAIDGGGSGTVVLCVLGETADTVIRGFTIAHGDENGIICAQSSPTFEELRITENTVESNGGGVYCTWASPTFRNVVFEGNEVTPIWGVGGGLFAYASNVLLVGCTSIRNIPSAVRCQQGSVLTLAACVFDGYGEPPVRTRPVVEAYDSSLVVRGSSFRNHVNRNDGVVQLRDGTSAVIDSTTFESNSYRALRVIGSSVSIRRCRFLGNEYLSGEAAACWISDGSSAEISDSSFEDNLAGDGPGGALLVGPDSEASITRCVFSGNASGHDGGGAIGIINAAAVTISECLIVGCTASDRGAAINVWNGATVSIAHSTIYGCSNSQGGGILWLTAESTMSMVGTIIAECEGVGVEVDDYPSFPEIEYCDIFACTGGSYGGVLPDLTGYYGNISADPLFCDPDSDNFQIAHDSPCVGAGPGGSDIGAFGVGCSSTMVEAVETASWGRIKAMYR